MAASVTGSMALSSITREALSGARWSEVSVIWRQLAHDARKQLLVEVHEEAHHRLLHGTPVGVLLWRICHVVSRDVFFLSAFMRRKASDAGNCSIRGWYRSAEFLSLASAASQGSTIRHAAEVVQAVEALLRLRDILYGRRPGLRFSALTLGQLCDLMNECFRYLAVRCDVERFASWTCRGRRDALVFPSPEAPNARDLIEVDAMNRELWLMTTLNDFTGARARDTEAAGGVHGATYGNLRRAAPADDELGVSPFRVQMMVLAACSGAMDLSSVNEPKELALDDHLPWCRISQVGRNTIATHQATQALDTLSGQARRPLVGPGSNWLRFYPPDIDPIRRMESLGSLGIDVQMYNLKSGLARSANVLAGALRGGKAAFRHGDVWTRGGAETLMIREYHDGMALSWPDERVIYSAHHPLRRRSEFHPLLTSLNIVMGHLLLVITVTSALATYEELVIGDPRRLAGNVRAALDRDIPAAAVSGAARWEFLDSMERLFERSFDLGAAPLGRAIMTVDPTDRYF